MTGYFQLLRLSKFPKEHCNVLETDRMKPTVSYNLAIWQARHKWLFFLSRTYCTHLLIFPLCFLFSLIISFFVTVCMYVVCLQVCLCLFLSRSVLVSVSFFPPAVSLSVLTTSLSLSLSASLSSLFALFLSLPLAISVSTSPHDLQHFLDSQFKLEITMV